MRTIEPKMVSWLDEKLKGNGLAQHAIEAKDARQVFIEAAKSCVGIREKTNHNDGPMVELIQETIGRAEREPWCMAFVQTCLAYAEKKTGIESPIFAAEHVMTVWGHAHDDQKVKFHPRPGAIIIWEHGNTGSGHCGIVLDADQLMMKAVEGNTEKGQVGDKIVREGGGVYFTERSMQGFPNQKVSQGFKLIGFLRPF